MTVLTQLSAGVFTSIWLLEMLSARMHRSASLLALFAAVLALCASTLHLGRPVHAMRALKMWRRSWLSREVLMFTLFACAAASYSLTLWLGLSASVVLGAITALFGLAGVYASARLYLVPGRPAWNSPFTLAEFLLTAALLGSAGANILNDASSFTRSITAFAGLATLVVAAAKLLWLKRSGAHELRGAFHLLSTVLSGPLLWRTLALIAGLFLLQLAHTRWTAIPVAIALIAGEFISRYLFFVSVVPTNMAAEYLAAEAA
jgi:DMSO reductase anchor subunit